MFDEQHGTVTRIEALTLVVTSAVAVIAVVDLDVYLTTNHTFLSDATTLEAKLLCVALLPTWYPKQS